MKKLLFAAAFLLPFIASAQSTGPFNYKAEDRYLYYGDVVNVDTSITVADLYKDAQLFIRKLGLADTKITTSDQTGGAVAVDISEPATFKTATGIGYTPVTLQYSIKLELKKGRYRYTIDNITVITTDKDNRKVTTTLYDLDKERRGGILGLGRDKRILKAMDALFLNKIELLKNNMKTKPNDF